MRFVATSLLLMLYGTTTLAASRSAHFNVTVEVVVGCQVQPAVQPTLACAAGMLPRVSRAEHRPGMTDVAAGRATNDGRNQTFLAIDF